MRIIAGKYKGLPIPLPKGGKIRPTTDRSKEALFSIIMHRFELEDCNVLDLFGGSGNIAIEFASRGARQVTSVELNRKVSKQSQVFAKSKNIEEVRFIASDVFRFISSTKEKYDIIFADPPYDLVRISELPHLVRQAGILAPDGLLIIEHHATLKWQDQDLEESRPYGQSVFSFFRFGNTPDLGNTING